MYKLGFINPMKKTLVSILLSLFLLSQFSYAEISDELLIDSAHQDLNYKERTLYFSGNVTVTQGNLSITAEELFVETSEDGTSEKLIAKGSPAMFKQKGLNSQDVSSRASEIIYLVEQKILKLNGNAVFQQGGSEVSSDTIEFDLTAQRVKAEGDKEQGGRVTTRLKIKK